MSNPYDPSPQEQQWGQPAYPNQPGQGYGEASQQAAQPNSSGQWGAPQEWQQPNQQWSGDQQWQPQAPPAPAEPAQIDWHSGVPQPGQAPWQGPSAFGPPAPQQPPAPTPHPAQDQPWVAAGTAQTAQEVAGQWQAAQPPAPAAEHQQPAEAQPYRPATPEQPYQPPAPQPQPPAPQPYQPPAEPQEQWPSYNAPAQNPAAPGGTPINEAATVTTPAVADPAAPAEEEPEALTIGRGRGNSIVLDDMLVSRQHVRITADADGLVLEDLGSRNGTYVNGRRVERTHLSEGDRIGIGAATFEVRDGWLLNV